MKFAANSTVLAFLVLSITMAHALPRSAEKEATHPSLDSRAVRYQHLDERRRTCYKDASALQTFEGNEFQTNVISPLLSKSAQSDGIQYDGFSATQNTGNRGILPKSGDKYLVNGLGHDLLSTTPCMKVGQSSGIDYFDLHSFYFGCSLVTTDIVSLGGILPNVPTPCTISLKGYYRGRLIGEQQFDFRPGSSSSSGARAQLRAGRCHSHFQGVDKVEFRTDNPTLKALTLDNISYQPARCDSDQAPARFSSRAMKRGDK